MATKKKTDVEVVEVVEEAKEATPKKTTKKSSKKKVNVEAVSEEAPEEVPETGELIKTEEDTDVIAEPIVEAPTVEPEIVEEVSVEPTKTPVEEPEKVEELKKNVAPVKEPKATSGEYQAIAKSALYVLKVPGNLNTKLGNYKAGTKFTILEEDRGWGKIAEGKWININYIEKI